MSDSSFTALGFGMSLTLMVGYGLSIVVALRRARVAGRVSTLLNHDGPPKDTVTRELKPVSRIRASSR